MIRNNLELLEVFGEETVNELAANYNEKEVCFQLDTEICE